VPRVAIQPRSSPEAPRPEGKEAAILDAALALFAERGFHGTAVPLVAERAGVGAGTVYRYFESKEALVNAVYQLWKGRLAAALLEGFPHEAPFRQRFRELWSRMVRFATRQRAAFAFLELHHHAAYLDEKSRAMDDAILGPAAAMIAEGQRQMTIKEAPPELLISLVHGSLVALVRGEAAGYLKLTPELLATAEECLWQAIRR
jgi:TetR/AcrR family transcriptional regulator, repressor of fatR-cypB operon